jgi:hypothetical protein
MAKSGIMTGWLTIIKSIGGFVARWGACVLVAWIGLSQLCNWYTTGGLLVSFGRGVDNLRHWQIITYETHPIGLVAHLALYVMMAALGLALCAGQLLVIRRWWLNNPKPTRE